MAKKSDKNIEKKGNRKKSEKDERKLFAFLATFLSIIGFIIALIAKKDDEYVMYYAKQSLVIFVIGAIAGIIGTVFKIIPTIGDIINASLVILVFIIWLLSWIYALSGKEKEIPIVSGWAEKLNLD